MAELPLISLFCPFSPNYRRSLEYQKTAEKLRQYALVEPS